MNVSERELPIHSGLRKNVVDVGSPKSPQEPQGALPSKEEALRAFTVSLLRSLRLTDEAATDLKLLLQAQAANLAPPSEDALGGKEVPQAKMMEALLRTLLEGKETLSTDDSRGASPVADTEELFTKRAQNLKEIIQRLIQKLDAVISGNEILVPGSDSEGSLESLLRVIGDITGERPHEKDLAALLLSHRLESTGRKDALLTLLGTSVKDPIADLLLQLSLFQKSLGEDSSDDARAVVSTVQSLGERLTRLMAQGAAIESFKEELLRAKETLEIMERSPPRELPEPLERTRAQITRVVDFYLKLEHLAHPSSELDAAISQILQATEKIEAFFNKIGLTQEHKMLSDIRAKLSYAHQNGDNTAVPLILRELNSFLSRFEAGSEAMPLESSGGHLQSYPPRMALTREILDEINRVRELVKKTLSSFQGENIPHQFRGELEEVGSELFELGQKLANAPEMQGILKRLAERLFDNQLKRDEAIFLLRNAEKLLNALPQHLSDSESPMLKSLERLMQGQDFLQRLNPIMAKMGEPVFIMFPGVLQGLISKLEASFYSLDNELQGEGGKKGNSKAPYSCAAVCVTFPSLGKLTIHAAHRPAELLVMITSENESVCEFLETRRRWLTERLLSFGFERTEVTFRTAHLESVRPHWVEAIIEKTGIVA